MAAAAPPPNVDLFDEYFRRADLDRDGKISGAEAVAFFQGSNLPKPVLAQVWMHADQNRTGFLGRTEFYNALKLVTVAQSGRALTPDIVRSALFGPAAAKIPAPKINISSSPAPQLNSLTTTLPSSTHSLLPPSNQFPAVAPNLPQYPGFRPTQGPQNVVTNQQLFPTANSNFMRPPQATPAVSSFQMQAGNAAGPNLLNSSTASLSTDWLAGKTSGGSLGETPQDPIRAITPQNLELKTAVPSKPQTQSALTSSVHSKPLDLASLSSTQTMSEPKAMVVSGNGTSSDSVFGGDVFSAASQPKSGATTLNFSGSSMPNSSSAASVAAGSQNLVTPGQLHPMQSTQMLPSGGSQHLLTQSNVRQNQLDNLKINSTSAAPNVSSGLVSSVQNQSQLQWPKMTQSDIKKYTNVFVNVDKDRDGKITGEEARNLFLSWRLPREVLKQVWDLSDQDNDSMLSLREFCIALYLMERYREGHPLPDTLPSTLMYDETLLRASGVPSAAYGGTAWQPGFTQQGIPGSRPIMPNTVMRPLMQKVIPSRTDTTVRPMQQNSRAFGLENHMVNKFSEDKQTTLDPKNDEVANAQNKANEVEKQILDSKEKVEYYRTKMQELVLYKSRCDNRLNEITERASADRHEVELLAKKYEEKYKQVGEIASKLAVEGAKFRDTQERKMELHNAIIKMEQGGSADGLLQVRVDRIQSDLEELEKALIERGKHYGLHIKATTSIKLPFGWQPGPQEGAAVWDENWDKFEDEGFTIVKDLMGDVVNTDSTVNPPSPIWSDKASADGLSPVASSSFVDNKNEKPDGTHMQLNGSAYDHSEEGSTRSPSSPGRSALESPFNSTGFGVHDISPRTKESHSDHGAESISGDKNDAWNFDDSDSVWGSNTLQTEGSNAYFNSSEFGSMKADSPSASNVFGKEKKSLFFEDSVPNSPVFGSSSSGFNDGKEDYSFNSFSRFDSFTTHDSGFFPPSENFSRFDSISSTRPESFTRFDSISSNKEFGRSRPGFESFDDADPFGSTGPFKSSGNHSPKLGSDNWRAF